MTSLASVGREPVTQSGLREPGGLGLGGKAAQERQTDRDVELVEQPNGAGEVVLQHRQELVVDRDPMIDQVVPGADQHPKSDGLGAVGLHNRPATRVGAQCVGQDVGVEAVVLVACRSVSGAQGLHLPGGDDHDLEALAEQVLDDRAVAALDADPADATSGQQRGDLGQTRSRVRDSDLFDAPPAIIDDAQGVVLPGPVDPGEGG